MGDSSNALKDLWFESSIKRLRQFERYGKTTWDELQALLKQEIPTDPKKFEVLFKEVHALLENREVDPEKWDLYDKVYVRSKAEEGPSCEAEEGPSCEEMVDKLYQICERGVKEGLFSPHRN